MPGASLRPRVRMRSLTPGAHAQAARMCLTYACGFLLSTGGEDFVLEGMEVWGVGGEEAAAAQAAAALARARMREKMKKVDKARMVETQFDREILFEKTFARKGR